ncbi:CAP domain-containing protein [Pararobbsia alpina]|uniref:CAP domain-containing protein n=1 Tax=Pararobbsia alpina TaxID=621374 RepID=UPI0039A54EFB
MEGPATRLAGSLVAAAFLLGACASGAPTTPASADVSTYFGPPIVLKSTVASQATASVLAPGVVHADVIETDVALAFFNAKRAEVGLPPVAFDANIARAASAHAHYLTLNDASGHDEIEGHPGFSGIDATARVRRHTDAYGASEVLSVLSNHGSAQDALDQIFASPYHRGAIFFDWVRAGGARESTNRSITVVDFADIGHALADNELVAYPYDGQRDVPAAWTDNEVPDPLGPGSAYRGQDVGYPITLSGGASAHIELRTLELRDANGHKVPCHIAALTEADRGRNTAVCTPYQPLAAGTRYSVHATGTLSQISKFSNASFVFDWQFATRRANTPMRVAGDGQPSAQ